MQKRNPLTWLFVVAVLIAVPALIVGCVIAAQGRGFAMLAGGIAACVALAVAIPLWRAVETSREANLNCINGFIGPFNERMQQMSVLLNTISEQQLISDRTKQVAYRTRDREALRRAIHEEMDNKDWEGALVLANNMEQVFGYKQEADRFRQEIAQKHQGEVRRQVQEGITIIDRHVRGERWQEALAEAHKVSQQFPTDELAHNLPQQVEERRVQHKRQLIESWQDAINRHDVDGSIEILRKLDPYLTPQEAEAMQEPARNLFKEKLNALRTQITLAVQDHHWAQAVRLGEQIMRDFPNTRAAQEVRDMLPTLRDRAAEAQPEATPA